MIQLISAVTFAVELLYGGETAALVSRLARALVNLVVNPESDHRW